jgi:hypothetical protein
VKKENQTISQWMYALGAEGRKKSKEGRPRGRLNMVKFADVIVPIPYRQKPGSEKLGVTADDIDKAIAIRTAVPGCAGP